MNCIPKTKKLYSKLHVRQSIFWDIEFVICIQYGLYRKLREWNEFIMLRSRVVYRMPGEWAGKLDRERQVRWLLIADAENLAETHFGYPRKLQVSCRCTLLVRHARARDKYSSGPRSHGRSIADFPPRSRSDPRNGQAITFLPLSFSLR